MGAGWRAGAGGRHRWPRACGVCERHLEASTAAARPAPPSSPTPLGASRYNFCRRSPAEVVGRGAGREGGAARRAGRGFVRVAADGARAQRCWRRGTLAPWVAHQKDSSGLGQGKRRGGVGGWRPRVSPHVSVAHVSHAGCCRSTMSPPSFPLLSSTLLPAVGVGVALAGAFWLVCSHLRSPDSAPLWLALGALDEGDEQSRLSGGRHVFKGG